FVALLHDDEAADVVVAHAAARVEEGIVASGDDDRARAELTDRHAPMPAAERVPRGPALRCDAGPRSHAPPLRRIAVARRRRQGDRSSRTNRRNGRGETWISTRNDGSVTPARSSTARSPAGIASRRIWPAWR